MNNTHWCSNTLPIFYTQTCDLNFYFHAFAHVKVVIYIKWVNVCKALSTQHTVSALLLLWLMLLSPPPTSSCFIFLPLRHSTSSSDLAHLLFFLLPTLIATWPYWNSFFLLLTTFPMTVNLNFFHSSEQMNHLLTEIVIYLKSPPFLPPLISLHL